MSADRDRLLVEAGRIAEERHWQHPSVVTTAELDAESPVGEPLIVVAPAAEFATDQARRLAALVGAGRVVLLVTDDELPEPVRTWMPAGSWLSVDTTSREVDPLVVTGLREAGSRGWQDVAVAAAEGLAEAGPSGGPLVVPVTGESLTMQVVHAVAALVGAGRPVLLVTDTTPNPDVSRWVPDGSLITVDTGSTRAADSPAVQRPGSAPTTAYEDSTEYAPEPAVTSVEDPVQLARLAERQRRKELGQRLTNSAPEWIQVIAADPDVVARANAAETTRDWVLIRVLSFDHSPQVRAALSRNPRTPQDVRKTLAEQGG